MAEVYHPSGHRFEWMRRTNELVAQPQSQWHKECLYEWFVANCAYWNELTYRRRQAYFDPDGDVWAVETEDLYEQYGPVTGTATAQQLTRKNDNTWDSFFETLSEYDESDPGRKPAPPGYWGSREAGYELRGILRQDSYVIDGGDGTASRLKISIGTELKEKYGLGRRERLSLTLQGNPRWRGEDCRLELTTGRRSPRRARRCDFRGSRNRRFRSRLTKPPTASAFTTPSTSSQASAIGVDGSTLLTLPTREARSGPRPSTWGRTIRWRS
jgi:putative transposase